jgi:hypothetical protein
MLRMHENIVEKMKPMIFVEGYFCPSTLFLIAVGFELVAMLAV